MNLQNFFDKIYYINLSEDKNKQKYIESQIQKSTLLQNKCQRYEAVIGNSLDIRLVPDYIVTNQAKEEVITKKQSSYGVSLTYGSLACALSHYLIYKECSTSSKPFLIFEDDIIINNDFDRSISDILTSVNNLDVDYDIIYLGYNEIPGFQKKFINNHISKPRGLITGLYGYIVSNMGAKKLINRIFPLNKQIDSSISDNIKHFNLVCSSNKIVGVRTDFGSKTQKSASFKNVYNTTTTKTNWDKLFQ